MASEFPYRLIVLRALTEALQQITPENGYINDLSGSVFRGRIVYGDDDPVPLVSILEPPLPTNPVFTPRGGTKQIAPWDLLVQGFAQDDIRNPTDPAHVLLADVRRALAAEREKGDDQNILNLGKTVIEMEIGNPVVRPSDDISAKCYFYLPVTLTVMEDLLNPYAEIPPIV